MVICWTGPGSILPEANKSMLEIFSAKINVVFTVAWKKDNNHLKTTRPPGNQLILNPKADSPSFAANGATAAVPLQHYQVDLVNQPLGLSKANKTS